MSRNIRMRLLLGATILASALAAPAMAQSPLTEGSRNAAPSDLPASARSAVEVTAGATDGVATIRFQGREKTALENFSLGVSTPTDSETAATVLSLAGIPDATAFELRFSYDFGRAPNMPAIYAGEAFKALCLRDAARRGQTYVEPAAGQMACDETGFTGAERLDWYRLTAPVSSYFVGFSSRLGYQDFDYIDATSLAQLSKRHTEWSVGANVGWYGYLPSGLGPNYPVFLTLSGAYSRTHEAQDDGTLCPSAPGPVLTCVTGAVGAPATVERATVAIEGRSQWGSIGFAPRVLYDFEQQVTGLDLPVYFIPDQNGALTGGIRFGWRDDTDETTAAVFISKPFGLNPD